MRTIAKTICCLATVVALLGYGSVVAQYTSVTYQTVDCPIKERSTQPMPQLSPINASCWIQQPTCQKRIEGAVAQAKRYGEVRVTGPVIKHQPNDRKLGICGEMIEWVYRYTLVIREKKKVVEQPPKKTFSQLMGKLNKKLQKQAKPPQPAPQTQNTTQATQKTK